MGQAAKQSPQPVHFFMSIRLRVLHFPHIISIFLHSGQALPESLPMGCEQYGQS